MKRGIRFKKGLVQRTVVIVVISVVTLVVVALVLMALFGKLGFFGDMIQNWLRFGS